MAMGANRDKEEARKREAALVSAITGTKVYLRGVEMADLPRRVEWINDPMIQRTLNFQYPMSEVKARSWLQATAADTSRRDFSIYTRETDEYIGFGGLIAIDTAARKAELYVAIGDKRYWGIGGYGIDAYAVLMRYGFLELGLNRIYGLILPFNRGSLRIVERLGWSVEGVLRQDLFAHGELRDRTVVSILRSEWLKRQETGTPTGRPSTRGRRPSKPGDGE